jgi:ribosomal protein S18 acetylase RimI-like enzyme
MSDVVVRPAVEADLPALANLDLIYPTKRILALDRIGQPPEVTISFRWRDVEPQETLYASYNVDGLRRGLGRADLFLTSLVDGRPCGLLMILLPSYTDAGEITDLAVDRSTRRLGAGRALVDTAVKWAVDRSLRALWVEPRADNTDAIDFYVARGFRLSGFNDRMYSNADHGAGKTTLFMHLEI